MRRVDLKKKEIKVVTKLFMNKSVPTVHKMVGKLYKKSVKYYGKFYIFNEERVKLYCNSMLKKSTKGSQFLVHSSSEIFLKHYFYSVSHKQNRRFGNFPFELF